MHCGCMQQLPSCAASGLLAQHKEREGVPALNASSNGHVCLHGWQVLTGPLQGLEQEPGRSQPEAVAGGAAAPQPTQPVQVSILQSVQESYVQCVQIGQWAASVGLHCRSL